MLQRPEQKKVQTRRTRKCSNRVKNPVATGNQEGSTHLLHGNPGTGRLSRERDRSSHNPNHSREEREIVILTPSVAWTSVNSCTSSRSLSTVSSLMALSCTLAIQRDRVWTSVYEAGCSQKAGWSMAQHARALQHMPNVHPKLWVLCFPLSALVGPCEGTGFNSTLQIKN